MFSLCTKNRLRDIVLELPTYLPAYVCGPRTIRPTGNRTVGSQRAMSTTNAGAGALTPTDTLRRHLLDYNRKVVEEYASPDNTLARKQVCVRAQPIGQYLISQCTPCSTLQSIPQLSPSYVAWMDGIRRTCATQCGALTVL
jgi:hypothetical protein